MNGKRIAGVLLLVCVVALVLLSIVAADDSAALRDAEAAAVPEDASSKRDPSNARPPRKRDRSRNGTPKAQPENETEQPEPGAEPPPIPERGVRWIIRVKDEAGNPVPGATIDNALDWGVELAGDDPLLEGVTGPDGTVVIDRLRVETVQVRASIDQSGAVAPVLSPLPGQSVVVELVVAPKTMLRGRVIDTDGEPVQGARVHSTPAGIAAPGNGLTGTTAEDGTFALGPLVPDEFAGGVRFSVWAAEFGTVRVPATDGRLPITIRLTRAPSVRGQVLDPSGAPIVAARARLASSPVECRTREDGRFSLPLRSGSGDVLIIAGAGWAAASLEIPTGREDRDLGVITLGTGRRVSGMVFEPGGSVLQEGTARLLRGSVLVQSVPVKDGAFVFAAVAGGPFDVLVRESTASHGSARTSGVRGGDDNLRLSLSTGRTLRLRLIDDDGQELGAIGMQARAVTRGTGVAAPVTVNSPRLLFAEPGLVDVLVETRGYRPFVLEAIEIKEDGVTERTVEVTPLRSE